MGDADSQRKADTLFVVSMHKKLRDPAKPQFTVEEAVRWANIAQSDAKKSAFGDDCPPDSPSTASDPYILRYVLPSLNNDRDDDCLYK